MSTDIGVVAEGGICTIRLQRAGKRNAITEEMYGAIGEALAAADADPDVRVALITGSDGIFTAGGDLGEFLTKPPPGPDSPTLKFLDVLAAFSKPLVAAVDGQALGVGSTVLLHCDLVYATTRSVFCFPFVDLGLVPEAASTLLLPRLVGHARAAELTLLAEPFDAAKAERIGIVNELVDSAEALDALVAKKTATLARKPPQALAAAKKLLREHPEDTVADRLVRDAAVMRERLASDESKAAIEAVKQSLQKKA